MRAIKSLLLCACVLFIGACAYIVLPEEEENITQADAKGWLFVPTNIGKSEAGDLRIEITIQNETGNWSTMSAADKPAVLVGSDGKKTDCETVFVSTGGHRLAPGFQMRGYIGGTKPKPVTQLLYVECKGVEAAAGQKLTFDYTSFSGDFNYYEKEANQVDASAEINLDQVAGGLQYPIATPVENLIHKPGTEITAINKCIVSLGEITSTETGFEFKWLGQNPGEYPSYVHLGNPPVIGTDGILYGRYESPDMASVPVIPAAVDGTSGTADWTTKVDVPADVKGLYMLLSLETNKQRYFTHYVIDLSGQ